MARESRFVPATTPHSSNCSLVCSDPPDWKRLISDTLDTRERVSLITTIFSEQNGLEMVRHLRGEDAQAFVDAIDKVRSRAPQSPKTRQSTPAQTSVPLDRSWITSNRELAGDACDICTGSVVINL